ncbi:MAG: hypothetical protein PHW82_00760 [Bacteroidales bacterium]|nr:hypothetical protein [Bacteroidales bacterium]
MNPPEQIPSYVSVDTIAISIANPSQGTAAHNISDCWLYVNNKLVGVFEVPFTVPVLESGPHDIQIEPGIKNSGGNAAREVYQMMNGYSINTVLEEKEIVKVNPVFEYRPAVIFDLVEDFEDIGIEFQVSEQSDTVIYLVSDENAFEGKSMYFCVDKNRPNFECRSSQLFEIQKNGPAFLEINFKSNDFFNFGIFSKEYTGSSINEIRKHIYGFNPTDEWKKVYIDLNYFVNNVSGTEFRLFFTAVYAEESGLEKSEVYIDNVKLIYLPTQ